MRLCFFVAVCVVCACYAFAWMVFSAMSNLFGCLLCVFACGCGVNVLLCAFGMFVVCGCFLLIFHCFCYFVCLVFGCSAVVALVVCVNYGFVFAIGWFSLLCLFVGVFVRVCVWLWCV